MLFQIATGWEDIEQIHQSQIVYLISSVEIVLKHKLIFFFSDGHARSRTSKKYTSIHNLVKLDWDAIYAKNWKEDVSDFRRKEKKQAEFFVTKH